MPKKHPIKPLELSQSTDVSKIVAAVFLPVALLLLFIGAFWAYATVQKLAHEESTPGVVVEMTERYGPSFNENGSLNDTEQVPYYYPVVEFYTPDEKLHTVQLGTGNWPPAYEIGEEVTIRYDPEHPLDARIESASSTFDLWFGPILLGFLGMIFLIVGLAILWTSWRGAAA